MRDKQDGQWEATGEGSMPAKKLDWKYTGQGWTQPYAPGPRPDAALVEWMKDMHNWGGMVATRCKDLEARVSELEAERDRLAGRKGGPQ